MVYWTCSTDGECAARVWASCCSGGGDNNDDDDVIMASLLSYLVPSDDSRPDREKK